MIAGILGVGHLASSMLKGLVRSGIAPDTVILSPRGKAERLASQYGFVVAADNADLVRRSDLIVLAVSPRDAVKAVEGLPWRAGQTVISVCAGVALADLAVAPAVAVRAMPLTASEIGASPTTCYPPFPQAVEFLQRLGPVIPLASEADFDVATVSAAVYGWAQDLIRQTTLWSAEQGLKELTARQLVAQTFIAAGRQVYESQQSLETLLTSLATPGGITELGLLKLQEGNQQAVWEKALAAVLHRLRPSSCP